VWRQPHRLAGCNRHGRHRGPVRQTPCQVAVLAEGASPARAKRKATTLSPTEVPASEWPPAAITTYCSASHMYVGHGVGYRRHRQSALPKLRPRLGIEGTQIGIHRSRENEATAVTGTLLTSGVQCSATPSGGRSSVVPTLDCQRILPALRSTATRTPHGGALHGVPSGELAMERLTAKGHRAGTEIFSRRTPEGTSLGRWNQRYDVCSRSPAVA
jgi:hypothetical protein